MSSVMADISIQYIGQVGFILRNNGMAVAIDPYLTDSVDRLPDPPAGFWVRGYAPPVQPESLDDLDLVLCTHDHLDHLDPETLQGIAKASPSCRFAAPKHCIPLLQECGISSDRLYAMKALEPVSFGDVKVHPVPAWHEERIQDSGGWDRYLGYVLEWGGLCLYHAGDTILTEGLLEALAPFAIDVGFLPINGRDLFRNRLGVIGNMTAREAADTAGQLGFGVVVPTHFDLYANNGEDPGVFVDYLFKKYPQQKFRIFRPGETQVIRAARTG